MVNHFTEVKLTLMDNGHWRVDVTKAFAPEHGGGTQTFSEDGGRIIHYALDVARGMVTVSPGSRTDLFEEKELSDEKRG